MSDTHSQIVRELLAEMRAKLAERDDAGVVYFSQILTTFTKTPVDPEQIAFHSP